MAGEARRSGVSREGKMKKQKARQLSEGFEVPEPTRAEGVAEREAVAATLRLVSRCAGELIIPSNRSQRGESSMS
jgi:hypothetical protein